MIGELNDPLDGLTKVVRHIRDTDAKVRLGPIQSPFLAEFDPVPANNGERRLERGIEPRRTDNDIVLGLLPGLEPNSRWSHGLDAVPNHLDIVLQKSLEEARAGRLPTTAHGECREQHLGSPPPLGVVAQPLRHRLPEQLLRLELDVRVGHCAVKVLDPAVHDGYPVLAQGFGVLELLQCLLGEVVLVVHLGVVGCRLVDTGSRADPCLRTDVNIHTLTDYIRPLATRHLLDSQDQYVTIPFAS